MINRELCILRTKLILTGLPSVAESVSVITISSPVLALSMINAKLSKSDAAYTIGAPNTGTSTLPRDNRPTLQHSSIYYRFRNFTYCRNISKS